MTVVVNQAVVADVPCAVIFHSTAVHQTGITICIGSVNIQSRGLVRNGKLRPVLVRQLNGWKATAPTGDAGPYKAGTLDEYDVYVAPTYDPNKWVMSAKSDDIRKSVGVFGEYMPITVVDPLTLANMSVQTAIATMYDVQIVNPYLAVSGKVLGMF